ncbi:hypothetical protein CC77DRAFT_1065702 [Alternaria alternata]|uniref:DUF3176 domain-containing protein n=1 Tax=Alternaria alternata TaxID=5599 RepID=A0A177D7I7_ALTAL|nr:hypothetical protein CC77DRAFT_1065702 [Alternaria alternata]OAG15635.1 hypothetical protein CC77DRAFT_1065702 [Alternaria alternata]
MTLVSRLPPSYIPIPNNEHIAPPPSYRESVQHKPSLDLSQRFEKKLAEYNASQNILKRWLFEIVSLTVSAICMGIIIGICVRTKDQPLSEWPLASTVQNVLSKIASAALILPISEAIGQLKWTWFRGSESKDMIDFEIFDKASRGAWGSFLLLFRTKGRSLAALGAILTLLLLAVDTFFQQVTDLPERWELDGFGEIPRVVRYEGDNGDIYEDGYPSTMEDINLRQATLKFFYYNGNNPVPFGSGDRPDIPLSCPSSRCEWDEYDTLGVCSACTDVSELLTYACLTTKLDWISSVYFNRTTQPVGSACGYWINATSEAPVLMSGFRTGTAAANSSTKDEALLLRTIALSAAMTSVNPLSATPFFGGSIHFKDVYLPFLDAIIVSAADGTASSVYDRQRPVAQECMLSWCVKTLKSTYALGDYEETVTKTFLNTTARQRPYPWTGRSAVFLGEEAFWSEFQGNLSIRPPGADPRVDDYGMSNETFARTQALFDEIFPSTITVANTISPPWWRIRIYAWGRNQLHPFTSCPWLAPNNVTRYLERLATAMTNVVRTYNSHDFVRGRAYSQTTFIVVHWEWLTFPLALLLCSLVFLIATIMKTSRTADGGVGVWKTSALPTLIYSLPKDTQEAVASQSRWKNGSEKESRKVKIRLLPKHGWRVSGQEHLSPTPNTNSSRRAPPGWI